MPGGRLLVLDDEETVGKLLVFAAQSSGFEARLCERPEPFFEAVADWLPTHVAIDLTMPEMDGIAVMRRLAATGCQARVIVTSGAGRADIEDAFNTAQALGLQTAGVLPKPFALASLRALLAD
jgi:DNA-binding response OmpR family regulator